VGDKARESSRRAAKRAQGEHASKRLSSTTTSSEDATQKKELPERGDGANTRARRVGDIRASERRREREERAKRARAKYRRYIIRIAIAVLSVLVVFFGAIFIYRSNLFLIKNVQVEGTSHLTSQEITEIAAVPDDATLLRLDSAGIKERLESQAWVAEAHVHRVLPDGIVLTIVLMGVIKKATAKAA
jgi:cell division protein FtsQ